MSDYELHKENIKTYHTLLKTLESEAAIIKILIKITQELQKRLEQKDIMYMGEDIYGWAEQYYQYLEKVIKETKAIVGESFLSAPPSISLTELKALIEAESANIKVLFTQITEMNTVSLKLEFLLNSK